MRTASQTFETCARRHIHACEALGGVARELVYDNLATAVAEHDGRLVRFQPRFLASPGSMVFILEPAIPASGWGKGKIERTIGYVRQSFWALRTFTNIQ